MKGIIVSGWAPSLVNFRGALLQSMRNREHSLLALAPEEDAATWKRLQVMGITFRKLPMERTGTHPWKDFQTVRFLQKLFEEEKPDFVFAYNIKPVIYSGIAAQKAKVSRFYALIPGLGYAFSGTSGLKQRLIRALALRLYRKGLKQANAVIFQNNEDLQTFKDNGLLSDGSRTAVAPGSGVPLDHYAAAPLSPGPPRFLFIGRLVADKGLREYVESARKLKSEYPAWQFDILGPLDSNPQGIARGELDRWIAEGCIDYLGVTDDVRPHFRDCHAFVLPSYYFEGIPRTLLEALSMGRPVITTDFRGCRETVKNPGPADDHGIRRGANGLLIPPRDANALKTAMELLGRDAALQHQMARASRKYAGERFDVHKVNAQMLETMNL